MPAADISPLTFRSVALGVSDLAKSVDFYTRVCGMTELQTYHMPLEGRRHARAFLAERLKA